LAAGDAKRLRVCAPCALLPEGWADDVVIEIEAGHIVSVASGAPDAGAERLAGPVLPGIANLHSHAFQRAMAGLAETSGPEGDSFWSWRELMYRFLERLTPDHVEAIAAWLYVEMLEAGYTSVAEFHYLHHDVTGRPYADPAEMSLRIAAAAEAAGIGLTLLPVLYTYGSFSRTPPTPGQRRFLHDTDAYVRLCQSLAGTLAGRPLQRLGIAPHSLRAVDRAQLRTLVALATEFGPNTPIHMHIAEQAKEVNDSVAATGRTPLRWLADEIGINERWCLIHATHMTGDEVATLAHSGAVAGLCPSTEGDLGDGFFEGVRFFQAGGQFGIGGDSHALVDPFMELRLFEYGQRLVHQRRNLLASVPGESLGARLVRGALAGGAQALGQPIGALAAGRRADLIVLDATSAGLFGRKGDQLLDAAVFAPAARPVRDVMVAGRWEVREGRHHARAPLLERYRATLGALLQ
jgi:formimidoylglutamate deiminase